MYFIALATDYDGTLATDSAVTEATVAALEKLKESGRKLIMVTGRELPDLKRVFSRLDLFDQVVVENGALLYTPQTEEQRLLAEPPPPEFVEQLIARGVGPISVGRVIVATWEPHETAVLETIRDMGLGLEIIFNKGAVMVLPSGVNKATGLAAVLRQMGLSAHNVVAVGDAENDHAFMRASGLGVAVANALAAVKETAGLVTTGARGEGVEQLVDVLIERDHALAAGSRHRIVLGTDPEGRAVDLGPTERVLITGSSGIGKSTLATALTERMAETGFQFCVFDPEGDYDDLANTVGVGDNNGPPQIEQVLDLLEDPETNVVVNTLGVDLKDRPGLFARLGPKLASLKARTGRPHWLLIDEAHHLLPAAQDGVSLALPGSAGGTILVTVHPDAVSAEALGQIDTVIALGPDAAGVIGQVGALVSETPPGAPGRPGENEVLHWRRGEGGSLTLVTVDRPRQQHKRHTRKYAEGKLADEHSFYFRGPQNALKLKAQNLVIFLQIAEGVDDATWEHHLRAGDYSTWFRACIKDDGLADAAERVETGQSLSAADSRKAIAEIVRQLYTGPASEKA